jgi:hypothetical protein
MSETLFLATPLQRRSLLTAALLGGLAGCASPTVQQPPRSRPTLADIPIPGDPRFVALAREVLHLQAQVSPDFASQSGLIDDALAVPSFTPARVAALATRLQQAMDGLRALPWRSWDVDGQIDVRWTYANAERLQRELLVERLYLHRPAAWLEPLANNFIGILTWAPQRSDAIAAVTAGIPALVAEIEAYCKPTVIDAKVALGVIDGIVAMLKASTPPGAEAAQAALAPLVRYRAQLAALQGAPAYQVVGEANYAWRLQRASLLPWAPLELLALAQKRLAQVDAELAQLAPKLPAGPSFDAPLPEAMEQAAVTLNQASLLRLYDGIQQRYRAHIEATGFITIPPGVGPIKARVTPDAMVPLTGDGGSMNPPPPYIADDTGWWNVEHFNPNMALPDRRRRVWSSLRAELVSMGPYAVHEGLPGHHLQLAIARLNPNPLRNVFADAVQNEGWALYAEQLMWEQGGLGDTLQARASMLRSWRGRIRRVFYDVNVATGRWTLQEAADWRLQAAPGQGRIDPEIQRTVNWPAQLICYFAGKEQILALKADCRARWGHAFSERRFNDELLALGSVPYVFARAKLLGEPVPDF